MKINTGKLKSYVLTILIISSIILTISLWFDDYHGFSSIAQKIKSWVVVNIFEKNTNYKEMYAKVLGAQKIIINNGEEGHWQLYPYDTSYDKLYNSLKAQIKQAIETTQPTKDPTYENAWNELFFRRSIVLKYDYNVNAEVFSTIYELTRNPLQQDNESIRELAIVTSFEGNILYINTQSDKGTNIYKYVLNNGFNLYEQFIKPIQDAQTYSKYVTLKETKATTFYENRKIKSSEDGLFFPVLNRQTLRLKVNEVDFKPEFDIKSSYDVQKIVNKFFNQNDAAKFVGNDGSHIYVDDNKNILKITSEGLTEFDAKSIKNTNEVIKPADALNKSLNFIEKHGGIKDIYLVNAQITPNNCKFYFGMSIKGIPVALPNPYSKVIIEIEVNNLGVTYFKRYLTNYDEVDTNTYVSTDIVRVIDTLFTNIKEGQTAIVKDLYLGYVVENNKQDKPYWVLTYSINGKEHVINISTSLK